MKHCIWCRKIEDKTTFNKLAHTIPQALGGKQICVNVCDSCNEYFGNHYMGLPSIETILKETFNITRLRCLAADSKVGKNQKLARFKSVYFKVDLLRNKIELKSTYRYNARFQEKIGRQLIRGIYKIFLEETERQKGCSHSPQFDFIREFARYNLGDYPLIYFERKEGLILMVKEDAETPKFYLDEEDQFKYLVREPSFFEVEFLGHVFGIATSRHWELVFDNYIHRSIEAKKEIFYRWRMVENFNDIDLTLSIIDGKRLPPKQ